MNFSRRLILTALVLFTFFFALNTSDAQAQVPCNATSTVCGQKTYDVCPPSPVCDGTRAAYDCYQSTNTACRGRIYCAPEDNKCGATIQSTCTNDCLTKDASMCSGNGIRTCGYYDSDPCLEWSSASACPAGSTCSSGVCQGSAGSCTEPGYASCYTYSYTYGAATSTTKLAASNSYDRGLVFNCGLDASCVKDTFDVYYKCSGDKLTYVIGNTATCTSSGCSGTSAQLDGKITLKSAPGKGYPLVHFYCWDRTDQSGWWSWTYTNLYYNPWDQIYEVKCWNDSQCGQNSYCDQATEYNTWQCKAGSRPAAGSLSLAPSPSPSLSPSPSPSPLPSPSPSSSPSPVSSPSPIASALPYASPVPSISPNPNAFSANPCVLASASWGATNTNPVIEGASLNLNVSSSGDCSGKQVEFKIWEDDGIFGSNAVTLNPSPVSITGNATTTTWVSEYQCDGLNCASDPPEYYFEVKIVGGNTLLRSSNPQIQVNKASSVSGPNTINGFVYIDSNQNRVKDAGEKCYAGEVRVSISLPGKASVTINQDADCKAGYKFENLPDNTYTVTIQPITGVESTNTIPWQQSVTVP